jgi:hypothetical protein
MTDEVNGAPAANPNQVNLDLTRNLRNLLQMAERGMIGSLVVIGSDPRGNPIKGVFVKPEHLYVVTVGLLTTQVRLTQGILEMEAGVGVPASPIQRATGMPNGA